jgi:uncharacterized membrane protein
MGILIVLLVGSASLLLTIALPVVSFLRASRVAAENAALRARIAAIEEHLRQLAAAQHPPAAAPTPAVSDAPPGPAQPEPAAPIEPLEIAVAPVAVPAGARDEATVPPLVGESAIPAPPPLPALPAGDPAAAASSPRAHDAGADGSATGLEEAIGGRLLLYVGTIVVVLGAAFFLKYAFDREWITESMRVVFGALAGMALVAGGLRLEAAGYSTYGQVLTGGGLAVLYLAAYAAFGFYGLIGSLTAFVLLTLVTVGAAMLADQQQSQPMAVMAIGGGFLTPFLVGGSTDAQVTLFSYVILLVVGTLYLARRREWPMLNVFSYALTIVTVAAWADAYYVRSKYLRTELFLTAFCALFILALVHARRLGTARGKLVAIVLASAPVFYHAASVGILAAHGVAFLVYVIAFTVVGVGWATRRTRPEVRVLLWLAVLLPLLAWIDVHQSHNWIAPSLATLGAVFALHLLAQIELLTRRQGEPAHVDLLLLHLNGLGLFLGVYVLLERQEAAWVPVIGLALVGLHAGLAWWLRPRHSDAGLHAMAVAFALLAATVGVKFDGPFLTVAWAAEGAAVMWIGLEARRDWFRAAGAALLSVSAGRWLALSVLQPVPANFRLFANEPTAVGVWIIALCYSLAWLHRARRAPEHSYGRTIAILLVGASVATVILLTAQNQSYWYIQGASNPDATFAGRLVLSLTWALYAGALVAIGVRLGYRPIRYVAMVLFGITVVKVFVADLSGLEGIYRVLGLLAVGTILLLASFLYQRRKRTDGTVDR